MPFPFIFSSAKKPAQLPIAHGHLAPRLPIAHDSSRQDQSQRGPTGSHRNLSGAIGPKNNSPERSWCLPPKADWLSDPCPLKIWKKPRQVGATTTDALDSVLKASPAGAKFDVWVTSRDEFQACLYLEDSKVWAKILHVAAVDLGRVVLDRMSNLSAHVIEF